MPPRPRDYLARVTPYEWEASAAQVAAAAGIPESEVVHFDTNTTSWPPVAWEQTALELVRVSANEYPHPSNEPLRSALARRLDVAPEQVIITCGADEGLTLIASAYLEPGRAAVMADPTFAMFRVVSEVAGASLIAVPVDENWDVPQDAIVTAARGANVGVVWLCSPSNPTGRVLNDNLVQAVLEAAPDALVCIDEAYFEISGVTHAAVARRYPNAVLLRTFSKGYGLAGARVGYMVGVPEVMRTIEKVRPPQNLTVFGITAACQALADEAGLRQRVNALIGERERLGAALRERGWQVVPSSGNFFLTRPPGGQARDVAAWLQAGGLIVRSYAGHPRLNEWLRIAVRAPEEDDRLLRRLDARPA